MDGCEFVQSDLAGTQLPHAHHLPQLLIADEGLVDLEDGLFEDEINRVPQDLL